jgi:hypothetical protein
MVLKTVPPGIGKEFMDTKKAAAKDAAAAQAGAPPPQRAKTARAGDPGACAYVVRGDAKFRGNTVAKGDRENPVTYFRIHRISGRI